jgi:hypothetical protein
MSEEWQKLLNKICYLQGDISPFKVDFLDRDSFRQFSENLRSYVEAYQNIYITGYFSETIREVLEQLIKSLENRKVNLLCPEFPAESKRDRRNLEALEKLVKAGAEVKFNNRLHARFLVAHNLARDASLRGLLVIGSFDFNTECLGRERYDAGIKTMNPDLVKSAVSLFEQIWKEPESKPLIEK